MTKRTMIIAIVGLALILAGAWYYYTNRNDVGANQSAETEEVVARVNTEAITRTELESTQKQIAENGQVDTTTLDETARKALETQALDFLVGNRLLGQATVAAGIVTPEAAIDAEMVTVKARFADDAAFQKALTDQSVTEADLRTEIAVGLAKQTYLEQSLNLEAVTVTDEEINALYEQDAASQAEMPPLEEVRDQIADYVKQQKQQEIVLAHVAELRAAATVEILI